MCPNCKAEIEALDWNFCPCCGISLRPYQHVCSGCDHGQNRQFFSGERGPYCGICGALNSYMTPAVILPEEALA